MDGAARGLTRFPAAPAAPDSREWLAYYGLRDTPFQAAGRLRAPWLSTGHREALAALTMAARRGDGILVLTGDPGIGKSCLATRLVATLAGEPIVIGRIDRPLFEAPDLALAVADAFGIRVEAASFGAFAQRVREFLGDVASAGKKALLIVDEAQSLSDELLAAVLDLATAASDHGHSLAILLVGQGELAVTLSKAQHAALRERITATSILHPLSPGEVGEYVDSRLREGGSERVIFGADAIRRIAAIARGAPGVIDVVCERVLRAGYARRAPVIGQDVVDNCLGDPGPATALLPIERPSSQRRRGPRRVLWGVLLTAAITGPIAYGFQVGWLHRTSGGPAADKAREVLPQRRDDPGAPDGKPGQAGDVGQASGRPAEALVRMPAAPMSESRISRGKISDEKSPMGKDSDSERSEGTGSDAPGPRLRPRVAKPAPVDGPSRAEATPPAPERESDAPDPGAVIDWLLKESGKR